MTCQLPAGYDAWRLSAPEDRRSKWTPETVEAPLLIESPGFQIDATGVYDSDTGSLVSVLIDGNPVAPHAVANALQLLGLGSWGWDDDLDPGILTDLCNQAARDRADERGDWLRDLREDR